MGSTATAIDWPAWIQAVGSVLGIFVAVALSAWQWRQSKLLQQKTTRPIVNFERVFGRNAEEATLLMHNQGLSPAIIHDMVVTVDGKEIGPINRHGTWKAALALLKIGVADAQGSVIDNGVALTSGEKRTLIFVRNITADLESVVREIGRVDFRGYYESLGGDRYDF